jgi:hypothetical protein
LRAEGVAGVVPDDPSSNDHLTAIRTAATVQSEARPVGRYRLADAVPIKDRLLWDLRDISALTGLSPRLLQLEQAAGRMPRPDVRIGRRACYRPATITTWLDSLADGRGGRRP